MSVVLETTIGDIIVDLYLKERPNACLNFLKLCKIKYYNLCIFHKVERNFIAQTGDPTSTGRGGESVFCHLYGEQAKYFDAELKPRLKHEKHGTLSMVNNGNNMNGSQFFITLGENLTYLDEVHTVFGEVAEGFDVLLKINEAICDPNNRPYQDIRITHTVILHDPFEDPAALEIPDASPVPTREQLESNYIGVDEDIDDNEGKTAEQIEEKIKESEAKARATILEMVGDIPDADVKPPENVLFVCKLNPVTTSEDLEIIFSRFGPIVSCEVIKDKISGESLQYAFIEFEKEENCESAYFKMANCLIDDRRIHVDFSQSVSKLNWNAQGKFPKQNSGRFKNFLIKDREKKSDGYEMIFDMEQGSKNKETGKNRNRSPVHRQKRHSPERQYDRRRTSSKEKYQRNYKYFEDDRSSYKKSYHSGISEPDRGYDKKESSSKEKSRRRTSRSSSVSLERKKSKHSYTLDPEKNVNKKSYKKKKRHDSSSSSSTIDGNQQQKYASKEKVPSEKKKQDSYSRLYSNSPESYSKREYSKLKNRSRSRSSEQSTNKKQRGNPSYRQSRSTSPENSKRKTAKRAYRSPKSPESNRKKATRKSPSRSVSPENSKTKTAKRAYRLPIASPESNRKKESAKSSYRSGSKISHYKRKESKQRSSSSESSSQEDKSLSKSPETSKYKRKKLKQKSRNRSKSSSIEISYEKLKETKERHSYRNQSRSPEPLKQKGKKASYRSISPESPKRKEKASKHISHRSMSPARSPELSNKKWTSNQKSSHKSSGKSEVEGYNRLNSKSSKTRNLTNYDSSASDSDHKSASKHYIKSSKKKSHKSKRSSS